MEAEKLQKEYLRLVNNENFDRLELKLKEPNIFSILSVHNTEIRHSNFLGWLLNPTGNHGLGDYFIKRFLREIFQDKKATNHNPVDAESLNYQNVKIKREWKDIDLFIQFPNLVICIENKVWSKDDGKQLTKYRNIIEKGFDENKTKTVFVFLTPYGSSSSHEQENYVFISYRPVIQILEKVLSVFGNSLAPRVEIYLSDYLTSLKRNLMGTDDTNKIARDIYLNHKELLDFIFKNRPDYFKEFSKLLKKSFPKDKFEFKSEASGYVRFLSKSIIPLIPKNQDSKSWKGQEAFLFEFIIWEDNMLTFKPTLSPTKINTTFRKQLSAILDKLEDNVNDKDLGNWHSHFREEIRIDLWKVLLNDREEKSRYDDFINLKVLPLIAKVEKAILDNQAALLPTNQN